jgi:hypothetical protein
MPVCIVNVVPLNQVYEQFRLIFAQKPFASYGVATSVWRLWTVSEY